MITGYNPETDTVEETSTDYLFTENRALVRVSRRLPDGRRLKLVMSHESFTAPEPHEFLWAPRKALGVLDVWWSVINSVDLAGSVEVTFHANEGWWPQLVSLDAVQDGIAWQAIQPHLFESFLVEWQRAVDAVEPASEVTGEFSASE